MVKSDGVGVHLYRANSDMGTVLIHDVFGYTDYPKAVAGQLMDAGFSVAALDLYHGKVPNNLTEGEHLRDALKREEILSSIQAGINVLKQSGLKKLGTMGFCMGGRFSLLGACNIPDITFCVDFYGAIQDAEATANLKGPLLYILGSEDPPVTNWAINNFLPAAAKYKKRVEAHLYPNAKHAFHSWKNPAYNKEAADDAWARTIDFLSRVRNTR